MIEIDFYRSCVTSLSYPFNPITSHPITSPHFRSVLRIIHFHKFPRDTRTHKVVMVMVMVVWCLLIWKSLKHRQRLSVLFFLFTPPFVTHHDLSPFHVAVVPALPLFLADPRGVMSIRNVLNQMSPWGIVASVHH